MKFSTVAVVAAAASMSSAAPLDTDSWYDWLSGKAQQFTLGSLSDESLDAVPPIIKPLVSSEALQAAITEPSLRIAAAKLFKSALLSAGMYGHPTRVIGSPGHYSTLGDIQTALFALGPYFNVTKQYFNATRGVVFGSELFVDGINITEALPFDLTPPTFPKKSWVTGPLVLVENNGCDLSDYPAEVNGTIALIKRGECPFGNKSENAGLAGAVAAVIYNNVPGEGVLSGTLGSPLPEQVASIGVSYELASSWIGQINANVTVNASVYIDSFVKNVSTFNLIADTKGGDPENIIMLSGHSDSVAAGPGINDDGSGSISILEVAKALSNFSTNATVRFAWFSGEEEGLLGSDYYVSTLLPEENQKIRVYMDFDMMASPNYAYQVYNANDKKNPNGSAELKQLFIDYYTSQGLNHTLIPFDGRSDYDAFVKNGIPGGGVAAGAEVLKTAKEAEMFGGQAGVAFDPCYHQLCDGLLNLNYEAWMANTKLIAHAVGTYASSLEGFPLREPVAPNSYTPLAFHGSKAVF